MRIILLLIALLLPLNSYAKIPEFYKPYDGLLHQYVTAGTRDGINLNVVDYDSWKTDKRYKEAMELAKNSTDKGLSRPASLAYWINIYNLLTIDLIIKENEQETIKNLSSIFSSPWRKYIWEIGGKKYNLDAIENDLLRKMHEPRIHMAIVCASISCPNLRNEAYRPDKLNEQLDDQVKSFLLNDKKGMKYVKNKIILSPIFKWFKNDFGGEQGIIEFINIDAIKQKYKNNINTKRPIYIDDYFDYNWGLNK